MKLATNFQSIEVKNIGIFRDTTTTTLLLYTRYVVRRYEPYCIYVWKPIWTIDFTDVSQLDG